MSYSKKKAIRENGLSEWERSRIRKRETRLRIHQFQCHQDPVRAHFSARFRLCVCVPELDHENSLDCMYVWGNSSRLAYFHSLIPIAASHNLMPKIKHVRWWGVLFFAPSWRLEFLVKISAHMWAWFWLLYRANNSTDLDWFQPQPKVTQKQSSLSFFCFWASITSVLVLY